MDVRDWAIEILKCDVSSISDCLSFSLQEDVTNGSSIWL